MKREAVMMLIRKVPQDRKKSVVCSLIGHSQIVDGCFGEIYCGRCGDKIADALTGINANAANQVRIGHNCETCRKNYRKMTWRDKYLVPNPFKEAQND